MIDGSIGTEIRPDPHDPRGGVAVATLRTWKNPPPLGAGQGVTVRDGDRLEVHRWFGPGGPTEAEAVGRAIKVALKIRRSLPSSVDL